MMEKQLALFDLDNTMIDTDSDYMWGEFLVKHQLVDASLYRAKNREFYEQYIAGTLDAVVYNEFVATFLKQHPIAQLHQWREQYVQQEIAPKVRPNAVKAIQTHLQKNHDVVVISATNAFVVKAIAQQLFSVDERNILATELEVTEQGYTGKVAGQPNFQQGKIINLQKWIANQQKQGITYYKTYAYSDSKNDLPLLEWADVAIAVCPDDTLRAHALAHHWAIEDWSM